MDRLNLPDHEIALKIQSEVARVIRGLPQMLRLVTIALFAQGHLLLVGLPGVAKTALLRAFSKTVGGGFSRISGTPDLMPTEFFFTMWPSIKGNDDRSGSGLKFGDLSYHRGPLLMHGENLSIVLIDEINRIQSKTQSAFLEVMQERCITFGTQRVRIPSALFVATRNPLETEETFELPEAQKDRFMFEGRVSRPQEAIRRELIMDPLFQNVEDLIGGVGQVISLSELDQIRKQLQTNISVSSELAKYITTLSEATWHPGDFITYSGLEKKELNEIVRAGLSPRAEIILAQAGRVVAWMNGRNYVVPSDVREIFLDICNHRFFLTRISTKRRTDLAREILEKIIDKIPAPGAPC